MEALQYWKYNFQAALPRHLEEEVSEKEEQNSVMQQEKDEMIWLINKLQRDIKKMDELMFVKDEKIKVLENKVIELNENLVCDERCTELETLIKKYNTEVKECEIELADKDNKIKTQDDSLAYFMNENTKLRSKLKLDRQNDEYPEGSVTEVEEKHTDDYKSLQNEFMDFKNLVCKEFEEFGEIYNIKQKPYKLRGRTM